MATPNFPNFNGGVQPFVPQVVGGSRLPEVDETSYPVGPVVLPLTFPYEKGLYAKVSAIKDMDLDYQYSTAPPAAETESSFEDASRVYNQLAADPAKVLELQRIVRSLGRDSRKAFVLFVEEDYRQKVARLVRCGEIAKGPEENDGYVSKVVADATGSALASAFGASASKGPIEKAGTCIGLGMFMVALMVQEKKPGLAKLMVKAGAVAIAFFATLYPMAMDIPSPMDWVVLGVVATFMLVAAAAFA